MGQSKSESKESKESETFNVNLVYYNKEKNSINPIQILVGFGKNRFTATSGGVVVWILLLFKNSTLVFLITLFYLFIIV